MVRFKNRYLLVEILAIDGHGVLSAPREGTAAAAATLIRASLASNFGQVGTALTAQALSVKYYNPMTGMGIVRVAREHQCMVWAAMTFTCAAPGLSISIKAIWNVVHVAGTIRSAQKAAMKRTMAFLRRNHGNDVECVKMIADCTKSITLLDA